MLASVFSITSSSVMGESVARHGRSRLVKTSLQAAAVSGTG